MVGAIIVDSLANPIRVLGARRSRPAELAGFWEFPGGKVEAGESSEQALAREVSEELGVTLEIGRELTHEQGVWPISERYELQLFFAVISQGEAVHGESHDMTRWLDARTLDSVPWLPADRAALKQLAAILRSDRLRSEPSRHPS